ncbi:NFATC2-interacting protein-like [Clytia hemisphaerica]
MKRTMISSGEDDESQNSTTDSDNDDIFQYNNKKTLTFKRFKNEKETIKFSDSSSSSSDSESDSSSSENSGDDGNDDVVECIDKNDTENSIENDSPPSPPPPPPDENFTTPVHKASNPLLSRLRETISLDTPNASNNSISILDLTPEEETISLKIKIHGSLVRYHVPKHKCLDELFSMIATNEEVSKSNIVLTYKNRNLNQSDRPDALNLTVASIIECIIVDSNGVTNIEDDENQITIKIQSNEKRTRKEYNVNKVSKLADALHQFCRENKVDYDNCIFEFDGETFEGESTPDSLGIEDGDIVDVIT